MPVRFITKRIPVKSVKGIRSLHSSVTFGSKVISAGVAVSAFKLFYDRGDRNILVIQVRAVLTAIFRNSVHFHVQCLFADNSVSDRYSGEVRVLIIAEIAAVGTVLRKRTRLSSSPNPKRKSLTSRKSLTDGRSRSRRVARGGTSR